MKTRAIEFGGGCALGRCGSNNDTPDRGGVEFTLDDDLTEGGMGEMLCCDCAMWLARMLRKRVKEVREKQAAGLEFRGDPSRWRKAKRSPKEQG